MVVLPLTNLIVINMAYNNILMLLVRYLVYSEALNYSSEDVAILFSNRAACYLKIGDCHSCVTDCNTAIAMAPANSYKPLLRRALAYETMEKLVCIGRLHTLIFTVYM